MFSAASNSRLLPSAPPLFPCFVLNQLFLPVIFLSLIHLHTISLSSLLFSFSASLPLRLQSLIWFTYTLSHSLPVSSTNPPRLSLIPSPCFPQVPPSFLLMSHQRSPTRSCTDLSNWHRAHPLYQHELDSTLINGNGSAVTSPMKTFWYLC